jgi:hypothetical protein
MLTFRIQSLDGNCSMDTLRGRSVLLAMPPLQKRSDSDDLACRIAV